MIKYEKPTVAGEGASADVSRDKECKSLQWDEGVAVGAPGSGGKPKECRSITLEGCGDHSGKDINNSMSVAEAYVRVVLKRNPGESRWPLEPVKVESKEILKVP